MRAIDMIIALELDNDQRAGLEYLLSSKTRSTIKSAQSARDKAPVIAAGEPA